MKKSTFSDSQILSILKQHQDGVPVGQSACEHCVSTALFTAGVPCPIQWN